MFFHVFPKLCHHVHVESLSQGQLPGTDGSGCRQAAISAAQAFDDSESAEEVKALLQETWPWMAEIIRYPGGFPWDFMGHLIVIDVVDFFWDCWCKV